MISVLGAGSWGTALANLIANNGNSLHLFGIEEDVVKEINEQHKNSKYLPKAKLSKGIKATSSLQTALQDKELIFLVVPAQYVRAVCEGIKKAINEFNINFNASFVVCSKGIERDSAKFMYQVVKEVFPNSNVAALSGPNFAVEVAQLLPTISTVATENTKLFSKIAGILDSKSFKCYHSTDIITTEIAGVMKNVVAIASGLTVGLKLGDNTKAAIITLGLMEIGEVCKALGGKSENLNTPAGIGDLILTCGSPKSRNMSLGLALGRGKKLDDIVKNGTFEGFETAKTLVNLTKKLGISAPICNVVYNILNNKKTAKEIKDMISEVVVG